MLRVNGVDMDGDAHQNSLELQISLPSIVVSGQLPLIFSNIKKDFFSLLFQTVQFFVETKEMLSIG